MKLLLIDTATSKGWAAVVDGSRLVAQEEFLVGALHSHLVGETIATLLERTAANDLQGIAVGLGPGSYTGVRIGLSLVQGLKLGYQVDAIGFCSLRAYVPPRDGPFVSAIDARAGGVYVQFGLRQSGAVEWDGEPSRISLEAFEERLHSELTIVGPDVEPLRTRLKDSRQKIGGWLSVGPSSEFLSKELGSAFETGDKAIGPKLRPYYLGGIQP